MSFQSRKAALNTYPLKQILLLLTVLFYGSAYAVVDAQTDRQTLSQGESVLLTIQADQRIRQRPDLSVLQPTFQILGSKQLTISSHAQGNSHFSTRWKILLKPLETGQLWIPALKVGDELTAQIPLNVLVESRPVPGLRSQPMFIETELTTNELYINSQAVLHTRLYHRSPLPVDALLTAPYSADAEIRTLGEPKRYESAVKGVTYQVLEYTYAIYPRQSGLIDLGPVVYSPPGSELTGETLQSESIELAVLPPAQERAEGYWLPADQVTLSDNLQKVIQLSANKSLTRTITLEIKGLPSSQLPSLTPLRNELAEIELTNVVLKERTEPSGLVSTRIETVNIRPLETGEITLTPITIHWWDTKQDRSRQAQLESRLIRVNRVEANRQKEVAAPTPPPLIKATPAEEASGQNNNEHPVYAYALIFVSLISLSGWWLSLRKLHHQQKLLPTPEKAKQLTHQSDEQEACQRLLEYCNNNQASSAQAALLEWAQHFWSEEMINNNVDIFVASGSQAFEFIIMDLEHHIDHQEEDLWQGDLLHEAVTKLRERVSH